jgi:hypothetical protein
MISLGSTGAGLWVHCKSILSFAGTRHHTQTSNKNIANDGLFMGFSTLHHQQRGWAKAYSESHSAVGTEQSRLFHVPPPDLSPVM